MKERNDFVCAVLDGRILQKKVRSDTEGRCGLGLVGGSQYTYLMTPSSSECCN